MEENLRIVRIWQEVESSFCSIYSAQIDGTKIRIIDGVPSEQTAKCTRKKDLGHDRLANH